MLDISDSRRIEQALRDRNEALEEADRVKSAFVSNMSYELRTPLTSISGFAEMMQAGYAGELSPVAIEYLGAITQSTGRLAGLIDNVLDLTQGAAGGLPIERRPVDLAELLGTIVDGFAEVAAGQSMTIVKTLAPSLGNVSGDARRIGQAVSHLIDNAVRYVGEGGRVLVHGDGTVKTARIIVSDNGPGIESKLQARLFDPFARFGRDGSADAKGLGLPLVRQFIEAHGGSVSLVSEPGEGTVVSIELPRG
jgi:signal transduction histidine kinase